MTNPLRKSLDALTRPSEQRSAVRKVFADFAEEVVKMAERNTAARERIQKDMSNGARARPAGSKRFRI